jgi:hypothetical protein
MVFGTEPRGAEIESLGPDWSPVDLSYTLGAAVARKWVIGSGILRRWLDITRNLERALDR